MDAEAMARQARRRQGLSRLSPDHWGHDKFSILEEEEKVAKELAEMQQAAEKEPEVKVENEALEDQEMVDMTDKSIGEDTVGSKQTVNIQPANE